MRAKRNFVYVVQCKTNDYWRNYDCFFTLADARNKIWSEGDGLIDWRIVRFVPLSQKG